MQMDAPTTAYEDPELSGRGVIRPGGFELTACMARFCGLTNGDRIVDIGCGTGGTVEFLRREFRADAVGIDSSEALIRAGQNRWPGLPLYPGTGERLPFSDASAQAVFSECSLSVMASPAGVLAEIHRVLAPGGKLALSDVYLRQEEHAGALRSAVREGCLAHALSRGELQAMLMQEGFSLCRWEDRTDLWKEYIAALIFGGCSQDKLWCVSAGLPKMDRPTAEIISRARPGYFWLVAEKRG